MIKKILSAIGLMALFIVVVFIGWQMYHAWSSFQREFLSGWLGGFFAGLISLLIAWIAWKQLGGISKTSKADFLLRLKRDFFTQEGRTLFHLIENGWLVFKADGPNNQMWFEANIKLINSSGLPKELTAILTRRTSYSAYEIDDLLLGHFEDVGLLVRRGVLDVQFAYEEFSWYVSVVWEDKEVKRYILTIRSEDEDSWDTYDQMEYLYRRCTIFGSKKKTSRWSNVR